MTMPSTYANEDFDRTQSRAMKRCRYLGHTHAGYCDESIERAAVDWEIQKADVAGVWLHVEGLNHCTEKVEKISWSIDHHSFPCDRHGWAGCVFGPGAADMLATLQERGAKMRGK